MRFQEKYQIQSALSGGEFRTYRALQMSSGRIVLVHHLAAGEGSLLPSDLTLLIFRFLRVESSEETGHLLDMGEYEGRIYVVTSDVAQCLNLRQWLEAVSGGRTGTVGGAQAAAGTPGPTNPNSTRNFTIEAFREILGFRDDAPVPAPSQPLAPRPPAPPTGNVPGAWPPPPQVPASAPAVANRTPAQVAGSWQKSAPLAGPPRPPVSIPLPPPSPRISNGPTGVSKVAGKNPPAPVSFVDLDTAMLTSPAPKAKGSASQLEDFILAPPSVMKPAVDPNKTVKVPPPPAPGGFEAVFQSCESPLASTSLDLSRVPPAANRPAVSAAGPTPAPTSAASTNINSPQPSLYVTYDTPLHPAGKKRNNWAPILILSSLFLMTLGLLLFYAFKH